MREWFVGVLYVIVMMSALEATVYEDGEDGQILRWAISDSDPSGAIIENIEDNNQGSRVIQFTGAGYDNQYRIGNISEQAGAWGETDKNYFLWSIKNSDGFFVDVILNTSNGLRYLRYSDDDTSHGVDGDVINHGVGYDAANGQWHHFTRNLEDDLKAFESNNTIISVDGVMIRGNCSIDNIELLSSLPVKKAFIVYEDAEDGATTGWSIVENGSSDATVSNVFEPKTNSKVIQLEGNNSYANLYQLGGSWSNANNFNISWDMKTTQGFIIDVIVSSSEGERYLRYTDNDVTSKGIDGGTIYYGLGYYSTNGGWHSYRRNLEKDLQAFEPNNKLLAVEAFTIRANALLDNIELFTSPNRVYEDAEDGLATRWQHYMAPEGATITNVYDATKKSKVISLQGNGYANQYMNGGDVGEAQAWRDTTHSNLKWSMKNSGGFIIYVVTTTQDGARYIKYDDSDFTQSSIVDNEISYGLGYSASNGAWHTYIRDVGADIKKFEPNNELLSIEGFLMIGTAQIDDLELFNIVHPATHKAGLALTFDDYDVDGWYSMKDIFSNYGVKATFFVRDFHTLTADQISKLHALESTYNEIGCHSYSHQGVGRDFNNDPNRIQEYIDTQILPAINNMQAAGFNPTSFAYPYGEHDTAYDTAVSAYLPYLRTTAGDANRVLTQLDEIYHKQGKYYTILAGDGIDNSYGNEFDEIQQAIIRAREQGEIVTFYGHEVLNDPENHYAVSPEKLQRIVEMAQQAGLQFYSFKEAYLAGQ